MTFVKPVIGGIKLDQAITNPVIGSYRRAKSIVQTKVLKDIRLQWEVEIPPLQDSATLKDRISKRGFTVDLVIDETQKSEWDNTQKKTTAVVSFPETPQEEKDDGYFSDGWEKDFRASILQKKIQAFNEKRYKPILSKIINFLNSEPLINKIEFYITKYCTKITIDWVEEELIKLGYKVEITKGTRTLEDPYNYMGSFYKITCINPKVHNTKNVFYDIE